MDYMACVLRWRFFLSVCLLTAVVLPLAYFCPVITGHVSKGAYELFRVAKRIPVTNAMITNWILAIIIILGVRFAIGKKPRVVPGRGQAVVEMIMEKLQDLFEPIVGKRVMPHVFPLLLTFFVYILVQNLSGLFPGVGAFGLRSGDHFYYFFRPTNADLNATLGLALVSFFGWFYFVLRYAGPKEFFHDTFGNKADRKELPGLIYLSLGLVFIGVGLVDVVSMLFRVVSLSFRLYGNVFGGENLITEMLGLMGYLFPVPFYLLEVLIGLIQAVVFTMLTAVYIGLLTNHDTE
ncbi:MAG: F0F1 ATP synthase subunit A [Puniceicoccales bacterium]|jgi:F-type H+-transporting ATPase subunit a|nr:F0F1 ATP synthase subunit A [Puniceicoccales bacterium]